MFIATSLLAMNAFWDTKIGFFWHIHPCVLFIPSSWNDYSFMME